MHEKQMSGFEKSTLLWARTAVILSALAALFVCAQWWEMHKGGTDTHSLAVAAGNQATWTQNLAIAANTQATDTHTLAQQAVTQAIQTTNLATATQDLAIAAKKQAAEATAQAEEAKVAANAAMSSAQTAKDALHISQRAYIVLGVPELVTPENTLKIPIENSGHMASGLAVVHSNEATFNLAPNLVGNTMVNGWGEMTLQAIAPGAGKVSINIPVPTLDLNKLKDGTQFIHVAGKISYTDGFPDTPKQVVSFCFISASVEPAKHIQFQGCDPDVEIPQMEKWDENEDPKYRWPSFQ